MSTPKRPVKIASASGSVTDLVENLVELAEHADADFIVGDWMSEYNMAIRGMTRAARDAGSGASDPLAGDGDDAFEANFVESITPALPHLARRGIRVAVNAGACDTQRLHAKLETLVKDAGLNLKVSWVSGDEVLPQVKALQAEGADLPHLTTGQKLADWPFTPLYAQCYLGCWGIVEAFRAGADIVVCGRVADAAPTMAAAAAWHYWSRADLSQLAHSLVAGHLIECSYYVTGGNFSGFKDMLVGVDNPLLNLPIASVQHDGTFHIGIHNSDGPRRRSGTVTVDTVRAQLVYELQGPLYYNSDVVAVLPDIRIEAAGPDRVYVHNVGYEMPPPTTKVGVTAFGGYVAEAKYYVAGLDADEKIALLERQLRHYLDIKSFTHFAVTAAGVPETNPRSQDRSTVEVRIIAQAATPEPLARNRFLIRCMNMVMSAYPGATFAIDPRAGLPRPFCEYFVTLLPLDRLEHVAHNPWAGEPNLQDIKVPAPTDTVPYRFRQVEAETEAAVDNLDDFGPTMLAPLGHIVHARSGDKSSDCNVGFFVRHEDEYPWLRRFLTNARMIELLQDDYNGKTIERFELPNIHAVHFLLKDHLDRGVASNTTYDVLGKNLGEYLRARHVPLPTRFLERGKI